MSSAALIFSATFSNVLAEMEHAFQEKKSQSQNLIQHFEFSRTFSALAVEQ